MQDKLAIFGGTPAITGSVAPYRSLGEAEVSAVVDVVRSGVLSGFYGSPGEQFDGGPKVREFERRWSARFNTRNAISVNSATSGLFGALGAIGLSPGDEVIVPPLTMSASVVAPLVYGGIPVFADIEDKTFCLDPAAVEAAITPRTRAIMAVNLFGHPAQLASLRSLADRYGVFLIEDNAQGPLAEENGRFAGTVGHIGVFSLNYHKHIHTGEGGVCVTDDDDLAQRLRLIRNHGENVVTGYQIEDITNLYGFNFRMTELSAAIGIEQLERIDQHVRPRIKLANALTAVTEGIDGLTAPSVRQGCTHAYYVWALKVDELELGIDRTVFSRALTAEGFPHSVGYVEPLYLLPVFQKKIAMGRDGFPFTLGSPDYAEGICPVAERVHRSELLMFEPCAYEDSEETVVNLCAALDKVCRNLDEIRRHAGTAIHA